MKALYISVLLAVLSFGQTTTIFCPLMSVTEDVPWTGRIDVALNSPNSAQPLLSGSTVLAARQQSYCIGVTGCPAAYTTEAGVVRIKLYTNSGITPTGTSYSARFQPETGSSTVETWVVAAGHTTLSQVRATRTPTPNVIYSPAQISGGGAGVGDQLVWDGAGWAPTAVGGSTYTASAVIDAVSVPDGSCVLDTTAVTITGAALGKRPSLGASYQPPAGVKIEAKVTGPNTMKLEVCNHSGAAYDPASATYYFGASQ